MALSSFSIDSAFRLSGEISKAFTGLAAPLRGLPGGDAAGVPGGVEGGLLGFDVTLPISFALIAANFFAAERVLRLLCSI